jgi:tetratricopeptide (TPR) repeat protein
MARAVNVQKGLILTGMKAFLIGLAIFPVALQAEPAAADTGAHEQPEISSEVVPEIYTPALLQKYDADIRKNPSSLKRRHGRAQILLSHEEYRPTTAEDIDTLLAHPIWQTQGERLKAMHLYLLGRSDEAAILMRQNIRNDVNIVEQSRWLARIELSRGDTAAALAAYRYAWEQHPREETYLEVVQKFRQHGRRPDKALLERGLRMFPTDPGVLSVVFEAYRASGKKADLRRSLDLSARAEKVLWPRSVDWKARHAEVLLALKKPREAEKVLLQAVDLMDGDPRLEGENGDLRTRVFLLLERCRG